LSSQVLVPSVDENVLWDCVLNEKGVPRLSIA
jgi:hypothetical protein